MCNNPVTDRMKHTISPNGAHVQTPALQILNYTSTRNMYFFQEYIYLATKVSYEGTFMMDVFCQICDSTYMCIKLERLQFLLKY